MADILAFPAGREREWRWVEQHMRERFATWPDAEGTLAECLPTIRERWEDLCTPGDWPGYRWQIPGQLTAEQVVAIEAHVDEVCHRLSRRCFTAFGQLAVYIFTVTWHQRSRAGAGAGAGTAGGAVERAAGLRQADDHEQAPALVPAPPAGP